MSTVTPEDSRTLKIAAQRARRSGVVQAVGRRPADVQRRPWESAAVLAVFTVAYSVVGYWLVVRMHVVGFETLDRWVRALMIFHNDPPKLAAVGFDYPPLSVLLLAPFAFVPALTKSLVVIPVVSALLAGGTMVALNTMMRRAQITLTLRLCVLGALGLNPLVVMYASIGARSFLWLFFVMSAVGALFAWYVTADIRFVMIAGLTFAVAALTGYGSLVWFLVSLVMVAAILARLGATGTEIEGTTVGLASPSVYVIALWSSFNLILVSQPFHWITESSDTASSGGLGDFSFLDVVRGTGELVLYGAPVAIVVLPALVFAGTARGNTFALWLGVMLAVSILLPGAAVLLRLTDSPMLMHNALPILLVSVVGGIWLARSAADGSTLVAGALAVGLLLSVPWTFSSMETFRQQGLERAFHDAVLTGQDQDGARTLDGSYVGYAHERDMADHVLDLVDARGSILTDNAATGPVILMTGAPELFFDRVDQSDDVWGDVARDPAADVDYLLLSVNTADDLLSQLYPAAAAGADPRLTVVYSNTRYVLVSVPDDFRYTAPLPATDPGSGETLESGTTPGTTSGTTTTGDDSAPADLGGVDGVTGQGPATDDSDGNTP